MNVPGTGPNARLRKVVDAVNQDDDLYALWLAANVNAVERLGMTDHGPVHVKIVMNIAVKLFRLLIDGGVQPSIVTHYELDSEDAEIVVAAAALFHDLGVGAHVGGARSIARQRSEVRKPAGIIEFAQALQVFGNRDRVAGLSLACERSDAFEYERVIGAEKMIGYDHVADVVPGRAIKHQAAEHRLLCFLGVRRRAQVGGARWATTKFGRAGH